MKRVFPTIALVLCLTLMVGSAVLMGRSYWLSDHVFPAGSQGWPNVWIVSGGGSLSLQFFARRKTSRTQTEWVAKSLAGRSRPFYLPDDCRYHLLGFGFDPDRGQPRVVVPWWFVFALTALYPAWRLSRWSIRHRRRRRGECVHCGYDLRASSGAACPECGLEGE